MSDMCSTLECSTVTNLIFISVYEVIRVIKVNGKKIPPLIKSYEKWNFIFINI